jgi:hypothetical protein
MAGQLTAARSGWFRWLGAGNDYAAVAGQAPDALRGNLYKSVRMLYESVK